MDQTTIKLVRHGGNYVRINGCKHSRASVKILQFQISSKSRHMIHLFVVKSKTSMLRFEWIDTAVNPYAIDELNVITE